MANNARIFMKLYSMSAAYVAINEKASALITDMSGASWRAGV